MHDPFAILSFFLNGFEEVSHRGMVEIVDCVERAWILITFGGMRLLPCLGLASGTSISVKSEKCQCARDAIYIAVS